MKFLVDTLPYYESYSCPLSDNCPDCNTEQCPMEWDKYTVEEKHETNQLECYWLKQNDSKGEN